MKFVDIDHARSASGVKLVVVGGFPSPWSEAAKGILVVKGIDGVMVRFSASDQAVKQWTGWHNAPVLMVDGDPIRTHWSDILEAAEQLGGRASLIPEDPDARVRMFGYAHELMGEGGLAWSARMVVIHRGLTTDGREGFPLRLARYLAPKYGYTPERAERAKTRVLSLLDRFEALLRASGARQQDLLGNTLTALDLYAATSISLLAPLSPEQCPGMHPSLRHALETGAPDVSSALPTILREHMDLVYRRHLGLPVDL